MLACREAASPPPPLVVSRRGLQACSPMGNDDPKAFSVRLPAELFVLPPNRASADADAAAAASTHATRAILFAMAAGTCADGCVRRI